MQYIITAYDKDNSLPLRMENRNAHLAYIKQEFAGFKLLWGGPFMNEGGEMIGSHLIVEADSMQIIDNILANDPYNLAGLFKQVTIHPWKKVIDNVG